MSELVDQPAVDVTALVPARGDGAVSAWLSRGRIFAMCTHPLRIAGGVFDAVGQAECLRRQQQRHQQPCTPRLQGVPVVQGSGG